MLGVDEEPVETGVRELFGNGGRVRVDEEADLRLSAQHLALEFLAGQLVSERSRGGERGNSADRSTGTGGDRGGLDDLASGHGG